MPMIQRFGIITKNPFYFINIFLRIYFKKAQALIFLIMRSKTLLSPA